jgi:hypothetical protein
MKNIQIIAAFVMVVVAAPQAVAARVETEGLPKLQYEPLKYESALTEPPPVLPIGLNYQVATDGEAYTLASYVLERNVWAVDVNLVAVAGYRVRDWAGATGGGLEYEKKLGSGYGKAGFYVVSVQGEKLKGVLGLSYNVKF